MTSDTEKLFRLCDQLARDNGLEFVYHQYLDGSGYSCSFQPRDSFRSLGSFIFTRRDFASDVYAQAKDVLAEVLSKT
jgi:hypothetical protein